MLKNFVEEFLDIVRFGNDHFAAITGYCDYVHGNITICHVYYVEGLGHNLFSVGKLCGGNLEVAFRFKTCYVRNLEGYDILIGACDSNLNTISISDMAASSLSQYAIELLKKQEMDESDSMSTHMATASLDADYRALLSIRRIIIDSGFELIAYSDVDYAGCHDDCKTTLGGLEFLGEKLVSWSSKKQDCIVMSTTEAEFTKIIIDHYINAHLDISRRVHDNYHRVKNDDIVKHIFNSRKNKEGTRMKIPEWMITEEIKLTAHYQMNAVIFWVDVPMTQSQPIESIQKTHMTISATRTPNSEVTEGESSAQCKSTNVEKVKEHMVNEEIKNLVEGTENVNLDEFMNDIFDDQEEPSNRIDPRSNKGSPEVEKDVGMVIISNDDVEEESGGDEFELRRRKKGKELMVITQDAPASVDNEKLQELTVTDLTPSSSSPKPKTYNIPKFTRNGTNNFSVKS
uniref:Integrase, catalytic region, zinc finger, CCHC-type, peptidase aspartic, catalytic n=1 Tax=Tanacetum cinerariifolium TaxID=118510 RepID=A0A6L2KIY9_TANCI|nr:hypothetical protein [Tanacetum cinerariifolium]